MDRTPATPTLRPTSLTLVLVAFLGGASAANAQQVPTRSVLVMNPRQVLPWLDTHPDEQPTLNGKDNVARLIKAMDDPSQHSLAVFTADKPLPAVTATARWSPTREEAEAAWKALADYGEAHDLFKGQTRIKVSQGVDATACVGLAGYFVQTAGVSGLTVALPGMSMPGEARIEHMILLNLIPMGPFPEAHINYEYNWAQYRSGPMHAVAIYDPANRSIVNYQVSEAAQGYAQQSCRTTLPAPTSGRLPPPPP